MTTTTAPATPSLWTRIRRALGTASLVPVFLVVLFLGLFDRRWTWPRAITFATACWVTTIAIVLVVTR